MSVIGKRSLPSELWKDEMLHIPSALVEAYRKELENNNLLALAKSIEINRSPIGGAGRIETLEHFATRYGVSICRVESVVIDPQNAFASLPDDLLATFSDGTISILDVPCGTGAAGTGILSTLAVLRKAHVIAKLPINVKIMAGDCSQSGLDIYKQLLLELNPHFESVGIKVEFNGCLWDAKQPNSTANLIDIWLRNSGTDDELLVIIANFSGEAGRNFKEFERSFQHIHERLHSRTSSVIWIEPLMKTAERYLEKVGRLLNPMQWFKKNESTIQYTYYWYHPFQQCKYRCTLIIQKYVRDA